MPSKDLCAFNIVTPDIGCVSGEKVARRVNLCSPAFHRKNGLVVTKQKSALNIVQDASAALPQNCLERIGY